MEKYNHREIEAKWAKKWVEDKTFTPDLNSAKNPYYALFMFPYPSAEGLHIGNFYAFTSIDVMAKYKKLKGFDVFEPFGFDAFGIHSENYALKIGEQPRKMLERTMANFRKQIQVAGLSCDYTREVDTTSPEYYKWTQWIFVKLFEKGLAYQKEALVNWCPDCKTVLADEQIEAEGFCERCKTTVEKRKMKQWFFKITDYAERLLSGLDSMDWSEITKAAQRNWIGKSEGSRIKFKIVPSPASSRHPLPQASEEDFCLEVFTTRADTLFGCTYVVLSPEHELAAEITTSEHKKEVEEYVKKSGQKSELERKENKEKTGVFTGAYAINPINNEKVPIWVADYVLSGYGTGAVMAVPAHDERDWEFAKKYNLPVIQVIRKKETEIRSFLMGRENISREDIERAGVNIIAETEKKYLKLEIPKESLEKYNNLIKEKMTSGFWNETVGEDVHFIFKSKKGDIKEFILDKNNSQEIEKLGAKYNDELYLGETSTWRWLAENDLYTDLIIHTEDGVLINSENYDGLTSQEAREKITKWLEENNFGQKEINYKLRDWCISRQRYWGPPIPIIYCEECGAVSVPERDLPVKLPELEKGWEPAGDGRGPLAKVKTFLETKCPKCGGKAEREADVMDNFLDSAWYFFRYLSPEKKDEVFDTKLGKKWLPIDLYVGGNEHAVLHLMYTRFITMAFHDLNLVEFDNPFKRFRANGMILKDGKKMSKSKGNIINPEEYGEKLGYDSLKTYILFLGPLSEDRSFSDEGIVGTFRWAERVFNLSNFISQDEEDKKIKVKLNKTIKAVGEDMENQKYNTAIAKMMELTNVFYETRKISSDTFQKFLIITAMFLPALTEELWSRLGNKNSIFEEKWPEYDPELIQDEEIELVVQINGKTRGKMKVKAEITEDEAKNLIMNNEKLKTYLIGKEIKKIVFIKGRLINIVL